ncbi:MAG: hypothetical protein ACLT2C_07885 [Ruminococcus sp.]
MHGWEARASGGSVRRFQTERQIYQPKTALIWWLAHRDVLDICVGALRSWISFRPLY